MARIILGLGVGQCGMKLLADILNAQPGVQMSLDEVPHMPWESHPGIMVGCETEPVRITDRFERWNKTRKTPFYGDISSSYLPYVEEAIATTQDVRVVCLERPKQEVIANFCNASVNPTGRPVNNWSEHLRPGWYRDPLTYQQYPKYPTHHRDEAISMYYDEYYTRVGILSQRFPDHFLRMDTAKLTHSDGVRELLDFVGVPRSDQHLVTGIAPDSLPTYATNETVQTRWQEMLNKNSPSHCVILVPFLGYIHQECDMVLKELEHRGYTVRRVGGYSAIDQGRNQMATDALMDGFEETLWIDSDVTFHPDEVEKIRSHRLPLVTGVYPQKGRRALASHIMPTQTSMTFGKNGSLMEMLYAGGGFMHVRREVYLRILEHLNLPITNDRFDHPMIPFFQPLIRRIEDGTWYLAEDYAFCHRARVCGYPILADTSIRLWHIGTCRYGWEDAGTERSRFDTFTIHFGSQTSHGSTTHSQSKLSGFLESCPWPESCPKMNIYSSHDDEHDLLPLECVNLLSGTIAPSASIVVVIGDPLGKISRAAANVAPDATILTCNDWKSAEETTDDVSVYNEDPKVFYHENWMYRDRLYTIPVAIGSAILSIVEFGIVPDKVIFDSGQFVNFSEWYRVFHMLLEAFPNVVIAGTGWDREEIRQELRTTAETSGRAIEFREITWRISGAQNVTNTQKSS